MPLIFTRLGLGSLHAQTADRPLIDRGHGLVYDVERDITWLKDANYAKTTARSRDGQLTWHAATAWVAGLNYRGVRGWRLPTALNRDGSGPCVGNDCRDSEIGHLVFGPWRTHPNIVGYLNPTVPCIYWTSTEASETEAYAFDLFNMRQGTLRKDPFVDDGSLGFTQPLNPVLAWPVHDGDIAHLVERPWTRLLRGLVRRFAKGDTPGS